MGLLGASVSLSAGRGFPGSRICGYSHRGSTRDKARDFGVADEIFDDIGDCVSEADMVILATPIRTFESIFIEIADDLKAGCIVTDVGSTKVLVHKWAKKCLGNDVFYVGSHPIAGSEKRGVEFARDDLLAGAKCIVTKDRWTDLKSYKTVRDFWARLGCRVEELSPAEHDRVFGHVSHLPHILAAAMVNASSPKNLTFAGKGFIDTSRVASGPSNIWTDIFMTNPGNVAAGIKKVIGELEKLEEALSSGDEKRIRKLLEKARDKRSELIEYKVKNKELI
jgi:prephenate dehydrogenase